MILFLLSGMDAHADNCSAYPYTLQNGQVADANQVMANFNNVLNCANNNLPGIPVSIANGGTGATDASNARTNLGLGTLATSSNSSALNAGTNALGARTISTSGPSGTPANGDLWFQY